MMNAAKPRSILSGDSHHRSVRSVRCWMCARVGEKTPDSGRFAVGALINCSSSNGLLVEEYTETALHFPGGLKSSGPVVTPDTLVIDIAPEFAVVLGVWNGDLFTGLLHGSAG